MVVIKMDNDIFKSGYDFDPEFYSLLSKVGDGELAKKIIDCAIMNITKIGDERERLKKEKERLEELATKDELTGIDNRREFNTKLIEEISFSARHGIPFSILMIDIDDFKRYNDTFGHPIGDRILQESANLVKRLIRKEDIIARYGGEEFVVILSNTPKILDARYTHDKGKIVPDWKAIKIQEPNLVKVVGNNLVRGVREYFNRDGIDERMRGVTISVGGAIYPIEAIDRDQLVTLADARLYMAKRKGKNIAVFY